MAYWFIFFFSLGAAFGRAFHYSFVWWRIRATPPNKSCRCNPWRIILTHKVTSFPQDCVIKILVVNGFKTGN